MLNICGAFEAGCCGGFWVCYVRWWGLISLAGLVVFDLLDLLVGVLGCLV